MSSFLCNILFNIKDVLSIMKKFLLLVMFGMAEMSHAQTTTCYNCSGTGRIVCFACGGSKKCWKCNGAGRVSK